MLSHKYFLRLVKLLLHSNIHYAYARTNSEGRHSSFQMKKRPRFLISLNLGLPVYYGIFGIPHITVYFGLPLYHGIIGIPQIAVYFGSPSYHGIPSSPISSFISARLCITASSVLPYHRLFRFCHSITASVFISYHRISRNGGLYRLDHLSWLFSYFGSRTIITSVS